jgi:hypothetical protein
MVEVGGNGMVDGSLSTRVIEGEWVACPGDFDLVRGLESGVSQTVETNNADDCCNEMGGKQKTKEDGDVDGDETRFTIASCIALIMLDHYRIPDGHHCVYS